MLTLDGCQVLLYSENVQISKTLKGCYTILKVPSLGTIHALMKQPLFKYNRYIEIPVLTKFVQSPLK